MLKKRVIPVVLIDGFSVLKTIRFTQRRNLGSPITVMRTYNTRNVDEMVILDIDASSQGRFVDKFIIREITDECFMPLTVGGGVTKCSEVEALLKNGADKVAINTGSLTNPSFVTEASREFGSQCIVSSVDVSTLPDGSFKVFSRIPSLSGQLDLCAWLSELEDRGAGEVLVNDVARDGTMMGANVELAEIARNSCDIPLIFTGGVSSPRDAASLVEKTDIDAVGAASIFHFTDYTPEDCRQAFREAGIAARRNL